MSSDAEPVACNLLAIAPDARAGHYALAARLFSAANILAVRELDDGYSFRFDRNGQRLRELADWIANETLCCSFFSFELKINAELWLSVTGSAEAKAYVRGLFLPVLGGGALPSAETLIAQHAIATKPA